MSTSSLDDAVTLTLDSSIATVRFNRPSERNAMTPEILTGFEVAMDQLLADHAVRVVIITGSGDCFSAGANLKSELQRDDDVGRRSHASERSYAMYRPFLRTLDIDVPVIAAMNGHAVGGGFGLSLLCDLRIANTDAKYGVNFARIGIHAGLGISYNLPRLVGLTKANEMALTGKLISGSEAEKIGLVNRAVAGTDVLPVAAEMARSIAEVAPYPVRTMKRALRIGLMDHVRRAAYEESFVQAATLATADAKEGVSALLEKRPPQFGDH